MYSIEVKNNKEIYEFCMLNSITDINKFIQDCFKQGFDVKKYGLLGETLNEGEKDLKIDGEEEKHIIKEVIVEKRVEIPIEVTKEVEKIIEVPVEIIKEVVVEKEVIKEVPVEKVVTKIEYISDKTTEDELGGIIAKLEENIFHLKQELDSERKNFSIKTEEMENIFQNEMSKNTEELDKLRRNLDINVDENKVKMLSETLQKLKKETIDKDKKIEELTNKLNSLQSNINKGAVFMKSSNISQNL